MLHFARLRKAPAPRRRKFSRSGNGVPSVDVGTRGLVREGSRHRRWGACIEASTRDETRAPAVREIGPGPVNQHEQPIPEVDQIEDVDGQPGQPGEETSQLQTGDLRDRAAASDRRHGPLVDVAERSARAPSDRDLDSPRHEAPLLHGDRADPGQGRRRAAGNEGRRVADAEHIGMPR